MNGSLNTMKTYIVLTFVFILYLTACKNGPPNNEEVKTCIIDFYNEASMAAGAGNHSVDDVTILQSQFNDTSKVWKLKVLITGMYENGSIAGDAGKARPFSDTLNYSFTKIKGNWSCKSDY